MTHRKISFLVVALVLSLVSAARPAAAQDIAGQWMMTVELDVGSGEAVFVFEVDGSTITGTYNGVLGEQEITGTIDGNKVEFGFDSPDAGTVAFHGVLDGDTMEGECEYGGLGTGTFTGTKGG